MKQIAKALERMFLFGTRYVEVEEIRMVHILDIFLKAGIVHRLDVKFERNFEVKDVSMEFTCTKWRIELLFTKWASLRGVVEETAKTCKYDKFKTLKYKSADVKYTVYIQVRSSEVEI